MVDAQIPKWNNEEINNEIENRIKDISIFWKKSSIAPTIKPEVIHHWDNLLDEWVADKSLPLYVRKRSGAISCGEIIKHISGRDIVLTDNYPALWSFVTAYRGERPNITDIRRKIQDDEIPIAMGIKKSSPKVKFKCTMKRDPNWRYCHIDGLGLRERRAISKISIERIEKHFKLFLAPSNIFVLPKAWGTLGEIDVFIESMRIK